MPDDINRRFSTRIWFAGADYPVPAAIRSRAGQKIASHHPVQLPAVSADFPDPHFYRNESLFPAHAFSPGDSNILLLQN